MYTLKLKHHFSAAHQLQNAYSKECNDSIHGHNWIVEVEIRVNRLIKSMVIDFKRLKAIINKLDHKHLNTILDFETSAENLSKYLRDKIVEELELINEENDEVRESSVKVTIWEAENASITYES